MDNRKGAAGSLEGVEPVVEDYIRLGLALGRHVDGFVDAYYGPPQLAAQAAAGPPEAPAVLVERGRRLLADLAEDRDLDASRRRWLRAQAVGLHTSARKLNGEDIGYLDEIEACYGVRPAIRPEDDFADAHKRLDEVLPGSGGIAERYIAWQESQIVPVDVLEAAVRSISEDFRDRTARIFGLPDGEAVDFDLVTGQPWSGFNYYAGELRSRVVINTDLPLLTTSLGNLVAHEAYPGHHTEHCRKEAGLVRRRRQLEESIFLVGTPVCLLSEGLADLGLEVVAGRRAEHAVAEHLAALGVPYDADVAEQVSDASEVLSTVRGNAAILIHERGMEPDEATEYVARWALLPRLRAAQRVAFVTNPTWRAYVFCYINGLPLCRQFVNGDASRFERLISEQMTPGQLVGG